MSTTDDDVQQRVQKLEEGLAVAEATQAGAQATQAAAQAGMTAAVMAGAGGFVAGMLLALLIALVGRD
jgi:F0F1-type ATP synthase assembly protein I